MPDMNELEKQMEQPTNAEIMAELKEIKALLSQKFNKTGWPIHQPTVEDEIAEVMAGDGDLNGWLKKRRLKSDGRRKGAKR